MSTVNTAQSTTNSTETAANQPAPISIKTASPATKKTVRKPVKKVAAKAPKKITAKKPVSPAKKASPVKAKTTQPKAKPVAEQKIKKPKLVRDSFTFPKDEYQAIAGLKQKALGLNHSAKKSEILRAGLMLLNGLNDKAFLSALAKVPALKTGRPAKS